MIQTTLSNLMSLYLWVLLTLVGVIWLWGEWRRRQRAKRERRHDVICRLCNEIFRDESGEKMVTCPVCQAVNERRQPRGI